VEMELSISEDVCSLVAMFDPIRVRQILSNTIGNVASDSQTGKIYILVDRIMDVSANENGALTVIIADQTIERLDAITLLRRKVHSVGPDTESLTSSGRHPIKRDPSNGKGKEAEDEQTGMWSMFPFSTSQKTKVPTSWDLGLRLSKYLIKRMNGTIIIKTELGGISGQLIAFTIPFVAAPKREETSRGEHMAPVAEESVDLIDDEPKLQDKAKDILTLDQIMIFACDDDPVNRAILNRMLKKSLAIPPENVNIFEDGESLLEFITASAYTELPPSVFFLDINMTGLRGDQLCAELRKLGIDSPIIATTGSCLPMLDGDLGGSGQFDLVIAKPYKSKDLADAIRSLLHLPVS